jgi:elongation factor Ts
VANTPDFQELVRDVAMHIAAAKPRFATREEVTEEVLVKEREIFVHQAKESGKPENIIDKIVTGKMEKFYAENCVLEQPFVKDTNVTIGELIKQKIALLGENINLSQFARFEI